MIMNMEKSDKVYQHFLDSVRIKVPKGLEDSMFSLIEQKEAARRRIITGISSAAAVVIILLSTVLLIPGKSEEMDYEEKLAALVEAYSLISPSETVESEKEILYEDESIIIYIK